MTDGPWEPKSRKDYVEMYADALGLHRQRVTEEEEKAKAEAAKNAPPATEPAPAARTWQQKVLGVPASKPPAS